MAAEEWSDRDGVVASLSAVTQVLLALPDGVHQLTGTDLDVVLPVVDALAAAAAAARYVITRDARERGEIAASQAGSVAMWVAERCPSLDPREAGVVGKAVRELASPDLVAASEAVAAGRLSVGTGCVVASEWRQLAPLVEPEAAPTAQREFVGCDRRCWPATGSGRCSRRSRTGTPG